MPPKHAKQRSVLTALYLTIFIVKYFNSKEKLTGARSGAGRTRKWVIELDANILLTKLLFYQDPQPRNKPQCIYAICNSFFF